MATTMNPKDVLSIAQETINSKSPSGGVWWFVTEIVQIVMFVMGAIILLWFYAPFSFITKGIITLFASIIVYDLFRNFVYVRYILWKENA